MRTVRWPSSAAAATARFTAIVVRPTPPFGLNTATTWPGSRSPAATEAAATAALVVIVIRPCFSRSRTWTWRIEAVSSSLLNGLTRNSRAPASIERRR